MSVGGRELVAVDKSTIETESLFDVIAMEDLQNDRYSPGTDESDGRVPVTTA